MIGNHVAIRKVFICSTGHVTAETRDWLDEQARLMLERHREGNRKAPVFAVSPTDYGWLFHCGDPKYPNTEHLPMEIVALMNKAHAEGADWIELDCDGDVLPDFPTWTW